MISFLHHFGRTVNLAAFSAERQIHHPYAVEVLAVVAVFAGEVVGGSEPEAPGAKFGAKLLRFLGKSLELGFGRYAK